MIEVSGSGSIPLTNGSGSGFRRPKNTWIRWIRIRNTVILLFCLCRLPGWPPHSAPLTWGRSVSGSSSRWSDPHRPRPPRSPKLNPTSRNPSLPSAPFWPTILYSTPRPRIKRWLFLTFIYSTTSFKIPTVWNIGTVPKITTNSDFLLVDFLLIAVLPNPCVVGPFFFVYMPHFTHI